jgi:DNA polymerase-3 subunit alpha
MTLFGKYQPKIPELEQVQEYSMIEKLDLERKAIGFYLNSHPMDIYSEHLYSYNIMYSNNFPKYNGNIMVAGILVAKKEKLSKNEQKYAFLTISDLYGIFEVSIFPDLYLKCEGFLKIGNPLLLEVQSKIEAETIKLLGISCKTLDEVINNQKVYLYLDQSANLEVIKKTIEQIENGNNAISFIIKKENGGKIEIQTEYKKNLSLENRKILFSINGVHAKGH